MKAEEWIRLVVAWLSDNKYPALAEQLVEFLKISVKEPARLFPRLAYLSIGPTRITLTVGRMPLVVIAVTSDGQICVLVIVKEKPKRVGLGFSSPWMVAIDEQIAKLVARHRIWEPYYTQVCTELLKSPTANEFDPALLREFHGATDNLVLCKPLGDLDVFTSAEMPEENLPGQRFEAGEGAEHKEGYYEALEGEAFKVEAVFRKRNRTLIEVKKALSGGKCEICGFSFEEQYGAVGQRYIIAHHVNPVASRARPSKTTLDEIALLCANCHAMVHTQVPPIPVDDLRRMVRERRAELNKVC